jgi:hypothetical protein
MVNAVFETGERLNFRKADLLKWRETYAEKMCENGVEMVANQRMELSATRPYTMGPAGTVAHSRAAASNGKLIAAKWQKTAIVLRGIDAPAAAAHRAVQFADVLQSSEQQKQAGISSAHGQTPPSQPSRFNQTDKTVKGFSEIHEKMAEVNYSLETIRETPGQSAEEL